MKKCVEEKVVGILLISTWKYNRWINENIKKIKKYFFINNKIKIFLHTDSKKNHNADVTIPIDHQPWPMITLNRFNIFCENEKKYDVDYLFYVDMDVEIVDYIYEDILCNFVVTQHPSHINTNGTPETNPKSTAYINPNEKIVYVSGCFFGGSKDKFLQASKIMRDNIKKDLDNNIIALWHDESHLNRYVFNNRKDITIKNHTYSYLEHTFYPIKNPKIIQLSKDFDKFEEMIHK